MTRLKKIVLLLLACTWCSSSWAMDYPYQVPTRGVVLTARGSTATTTITKAWADSRITTGGSVTFGSLVSKGDVTIGENLGAGLQHSLRIWTGTSNAYMQFNAWGNGGLSCIAPNCGSLSITMPWRVDLNSGEQIVLTTGANAGMSLSVGGLLSLLDRDSPSAVRGTWDSATGNLTATGSGTFAAVLTPSLAATGSMFIKSGTGGSGGSLVIADKDSNWRFTIDPAWPGNVNVVTGGLQFGGTTRIDASGNSTFASTTLGTVAKLTPQADPPANPALGWIYCDTDTHLYLYNGTTWKQLDN